MSVTAMSPSPSPDARLAECEALSAVEARALTEEVKADAQALWRKLLRLYEGGAHTALGYSSWGEYCAAEFDIGQSQAYRLLDSGRVMGTLDAHSPVGERPQAERVARELAPLRAEPEVMAGAWSEVVARHGESPTAAQVREIVDPKRRRGTERHDQPGARSRKSGQGQPPVVEAGDVGVPCVGGAAGIVGPLDACERLPVDLDGLDVARIVESAADLERWDAAIRAAAAALLRLHARLGEAREAQRAPQPDAAEHADDDDGLADLGPERPLDDDEEAADAARAPGCRCDEPLRGPVEDGERRCHRCGRVVVSGDGPGGTGAPPPRLPAMSPGWKSASPYDAGFA